MSEIGNLCVSRKRGETVVIGNNITVEVVEIRGNSVRLSFQVPKETPVHRGEVFAAILREKATPQ